MAGCLGNVVRGSHVTEPAPKDHVVSPDAYDFADRVANG